MIINLLKVSPLVFLFFCFFNNLFAQFSGARNYLNTPVNSYIADFIYGSYSANTIVQGNLFTDGIVNTNTYYPQFESYFSLAGNLASVQAYSGYNAVSSSGALEIQTDNETVRRNADTGITGATTFVH